MLTSTTHSSGTTLRATPPWTVTAETTSRNVSPAKTWSTGSSSASAAIPRPARWIALSASHGRALWPATPRNVHVALMFPTQPAWISLVGRLHHDRQVGGRAGPGSRSSSGVSALSPNGSSSRPKKTKPTSTVASARQRAAPARPSRRRPPSCRRAPRPWTTAPSSRSRPGKFPCAGHGVEVAGEEDQRAVAALGHAGQHARVAGVARARHDAAQHVAPPAPPPTRDSDGDVDELQDAVGEAVGEVGHRAATLSPAAR